MRWVKGGGAAVSEVSRAINLHFILHSLHVVAAESCCPQAAHPLPPSPSSQISHFEDFCLDCSKNIGTLEIQESKGGKKIKKGQSQSFSFTSTSSSNSKQKRRKQIYLVHQLPLASPSDPSNLRTHEALQVFNRGRGKMVVVHSEEVRRGEGRGSDE